MILDELEQWLSQHNLTYFFEEQGENWWILVHPPEEALNFEPEIALSYQKGFDYEKYLLFIRHSTGLIQSWQEVVHWKIAEEPSSQIITLELEKVLSNTVKVTRRE